MHNNYTPYHVHTELSLLDSCTNYKEYIDKAKEYNMNAFAFSEHGNIYEYYHKKEYIESSGMKYIHAVEAYVTESLEKNVRDNYHCVLIAANYDGYLELNKLISHSFNRKQVKIVGDDERYYYAPRMSFDDIINTSDNIIICTACIAGILSKGNDDIKDRFIKFLIRNNHRCFLEIQHHNVESQKVYNKYLLQLSKDINVPLIAGTDTHALDDRHIKGRSILQLSKDIKYDDESGWDLTFKSYDQLTESYKIQDAIPYEDALKAIENTNVMANMVEPFELTKETKYPHIYDNPVETFKKKINIGYKNNNYLKERYTKDKIKKVLNEELDTYIKTKSIDFMLLQVYLREWERENGIQCGYGRGSVSGSEIAYTLGITNMDSMKFGLNFFRFMNPSRVTNADIDTDYASLDRERVKEFLLKDHMKLEQIQCSEIITFNTIALKGAIRDVCRGLYKDSNVDYITLADNICKDIEINEDEVRSKYPDVFEYVDILNGTVVSVGSHPSGVLVTDINLAEKIGMCSLSTSNYPVSMLNMKELDALMYVKLDILGLDNIAVINDTCKLLGIDRLTPDNVDLSDEDVWKSIRDDTTLIFQWESDSAQDYLKRFMSDETIDIAKNHNKNFSYIKWFSFGNGLIRPGCASFRNDVANGDIKITGFKELDEFLSVTFGRITMQEDIMQFLVRFCGYSDAESDTVRRGIAKKYGTEKFIDEIHNRFISYSSDTYGVDTELLENIFPPIKQGILDATMYAFSWNHSDSYSCIGYICGYLRYYYPLEFITAALNIFKNKEDKMISITKYAQRANIDIVDPKFRYSNSDYVCNKEQGNIYKGLESIKFISKQGAEDLYSLKDNHYDSFIDLLVDIQNTSVNSRQLEILIYLDFFSEFGTVKQLLRQVELFNELYGKKQLKKDKIESLNLPMYIVEKHSVKATEKMFKYEDTLPMIKEVCEQIKYPKTTTLDKIRWQNEYLGYISIKKPSANACYYYVLEVDKNIVLLYQIKTGDTLKIKFRKTDWNKNPFNVGEMIKVIDIVEEFKWIPRTDSAGNKLKDENGKQIFDRSTTDREQILKKWQKLT